MPEAEKPKGFDDYDLRLGDLMRGERATLGKSLLDVQRELKIKATYIAAIENADVSAFESQGFVAGYVRSYARYLAMDPDLAFARFCREAGFTPAHGMSQAASTATISAARSRKAEASSAAPRDPLADPNALFVPRGQSWLSRVEPGAVGSVAVLLALIGALGYGGWSVLQEVQRVQLAPVDQAPVVVAEIDPLANVRGGAQIVGGNAAAMAEAESSAQPDRADRLYRPQALDVPVLTSRDGPIAAINPRAGQAPADGAMASAIDSAVAEAAGVAGGDVQVVAANSPAVELLAVRPSWVRVSSADGTVLFEKVLDAGERYTVPQLEEPAQLRAGNSGSVYFAVNGKAYGPAAPGAQVVKGVQLSPEALTGKFAAADCTQDPDLGRMASATADTASVPLCPAP